MICTPMPGRQGPTIPAPTALPTIPDAGPPFTANLFATQLLGASPHIGNLDLTGVAPTTSNFSGSVITLGGGQWLLFADLLVIEQTTLLFGGPTFNPIVHSVLAFDPAAVGTIDGSYTVVSSVPPPLATTSPHRNYVSTHSVIILTNNVNTLQFSVTRETDGGGGGTYTGGSGGFVQLLSLIGLKLH